MCDSTKTQKHIVLVCNSAPYVQLSESSPNYNGLSMEDMVGKMSDVRQSLAMLYLNLSFFVGELLLIYPLKIWIARLIFDAIDWRSYFPAKSVISQIAR